MTVKEPAPVVKLICCTRITPRRREKEDGDLDTEQTAIILGFVEAWKNGGVKMYVFPLSLPHFAPFSSLLISHSQLSISRSKPYP